MKRLILVLVFLAATPLWAEQITLLTGQAANCDPCYQAGDPNLGIYDLNGFQKITVQVNSTAGSVVVATFYTRNTSSDPWTEAWSETNPTATTPGYIGPGAMYGKLVLSGYVSGTLRATMNRVK